MSDEMKQIFTTLGMRTKNLSIYTYMTYFIKILSMHYIDEGLNKTFTIKEELAVEVIGTMQAHASSLRSLFYYPRTEEIPTKAPDTPPTIKSAMRAQINSTRSLLSQNFVDEVAGKLDAEPVCVRVLLGANCDGRCQKPHDHLDTTPYFALELIVKDQVSDDTTLDYGQTLWDNSRERNRNSGKGFVVK